MIGYDSTRNYKLIYYIYLEEYLYSVGLNMLTLEQ